MVEDYKNLFVRDLNRFKKEVEQFENDADLWRVLPGVLNSAGNLALHLCGNLRHFLGHVVGKSGYERKRDEEFSTKDLSRNELVKLIDTTIDEVSHAFGQLKNGELDQEFPLTPFPEPVSTAFMLMHMNGHLNYHLGQVNYLRRILQK